MTRILPLLFALLCITGCDRFTSPETRVERAGRAIAAGNHRAAVIDLMNALRADPENEQARLLLAEAAYWLGDAHGALRSLQRVKSPPDARRVLLEARIALMLGRAADAQRMLSESRFTFEPGARELVLGYAYLHLQDNVAAEKSFDAAHAADPALVEARAGSLRARAARGETQDALQGLEKLCAEHPESAAAWLAQGTLLATSGNSRAAMQALLQADAHAERQLDVTRRTTLLAMLVETQLLDGQLENAVNSGAKLARIAPGSLIARFVDSRLAMARNDHLGAVSQLREVLKINPGLQQAHLLLSMALIAQGNLEQASKELNQIIERSPENAVARQLLGQVRMRLDDPDGALRMLVPALQAEGGQSQVNALIDAARSQLGADQSVSLLEVLHSRDPANAGIRTQLAAAYLQAGVPAKAAALLRAAGDTSDVRRSALLLDAVAEAEGGSAARTQVDAIVAANPADARIATLGAAYYGRIRAYTEGRKVLTAALERGGDPEVLLLTLAQLEWSAGDRDASAAAIARLRKLRPDNVAARMAAGELALAQGALDTASEHFEAVRAASPRSVQVRLMLAQVALQQGNSEQADQLLREATGITPDTAEARNSAGMLNFNFGRGDAALEQFRAAVKLAPQEPVGWFNLARTQRALGQAGPARDSLEKALVARPHWVPAVAALVALDVEARDIAAAQKRIDALRAQLPRDPDVQVLEGDLHAATSKFTEASAAYDSAFGLRPSAAIAMKDFRARSAGNLPQPARVLERWVAAHPEDRAARLMLAETAMKSGQRAAAAEHYRALLAHRPDDVVALNNLAWIYHELGDKRAIDVAREAVRLAPQSAAVNDTLGWLLVQNGAAAEGVKFLAVAASQADADAEVHYHNAVALAKTGATPEARRSLEQALRTPEFANRKEAEGLLSQLSGPAITTP